MAIPLDWPPMKVFLTGATGFIGGHVAGKLRDRETPIMSEGESGHISDELFNLWRIRLGCAIGRSKTG